MNVDLLIQKSITGNISADEIKELKLILSKDSGLREELSIERAMYEYRNQELKSKLKSAIPKSNVRWYSSKVLLYFLTAILIGVLSYWAYTNIASAPSSSSYAEELLRERVVSPVRLMDDDVEKVNTWSLAVNEYAAENFQEALSLIGRLENPTAEQRLYEGLSYAYLDTPNYNAASDIIKSLQISDEILVYDQALWYGALIDFKLGNLDEAKAQLEIILDSKLWKQEESKKLLQLLILEEN